MIDTSTVLEAARDLSTAFSPDRQPDSVLLRFLKRKQVQLINDVVRVAPHLILETEVIDLPLVDFEAGVPFPDSMQVRDGTAYGPPSNVVNVLATRAHVKVVSWDRRVDPAYFPSAYLLQSPSSIYDTGLNLFLTSNPGNWLPWVTLKMFFVPQPTEPSLTVDLVLPDFGEPLVIAELGTFMAGREAKDPAVRAILPDLRADRDNAQRTWIDNLIRQIERVAFAQDDYGGVSGGAPA